MATLFTYTNGNNDGVTLGASGNGQGNRGGMAFVPTSSGLITGVTINLGQTRAVNATGIIYASDGSGGNPGTILETGNTVSLNTANPAWTFAGTTQVNVGTKYYFIITSASWPSASNWVRLNARFPNDDGSIDYIWFFLSDNTTWSTTNENANMTITGTLNSLSATIFPHRSLLGVGI